MRLYLLRHAEAVPAAPSDAARRLTGKGEAQAERAGKFCARHGLVPEIVLTSPVLRARQTAERVAAELGDAGLVEVAWAACGMSPGRAIEELAGYAKLASAMLVGHEPDLGWLAATLLGMRGPAALRVRKASLAAIDFEGAPAEARGELQLFVPARLM